MGQPTGQWSLVQQQLYIKVQTSTWLNLKRAAHKECLQISLKQHFISLSCPGENDKVIQKKILFLYQEQALKYPLDDTPYCTRPNVVTPKI